jgi:hypothetical protein
MTFILAGFQGGESENQDHGNLFRDCPCRKPRGRDFSAS